MCQLRQIETEKIATNLVGRARMNAIRSIKLARRRAAQVRLHHLAASGRAV